MEHCVDLGCRDTILARGVPDPKKDVGRTGAMASGVAKGISGPLLYWDEGKVHYGVRERLVMVLCVGTCQRIGEVPLVS